MSDSFDADLAGMVQALDRVGDIASTIAPGVAKLVREHLESTIAAGTDPYGNPWVPTKDGHRALAGAAKALAVTAIGTVVWIVLTGPEARHHQGWIKGGKGGRYKRPIIFTKGDLPAALANKIKQRFGDVFAAIISTSVENAE